VQVRAEQELAGSWRRDREGTVSRSGESDEQRFRELYDRTYDRVWAFVLRRVPEEDAANDVVSETFLAVWRRIRDVPLDARSADAWVFGTARRMLANSWRGSKRRRGLFERIRQRPVDVFLDLSTADESDQRVLQALERLRPSDREILALAFWEELDTEQIARVLGCTKNAAAVRLTRARQAWRTAFEEESGGER
jgi:RNA polymerase sigma-70 factor (ECF subfamily)